MIAPVLLFSRDYGYESVALADALLCPSCELLFSAREHTACPACGEPNVYPIARALNKRPTRIKKARRA